MNQITFDLERLKSQKKLLKITNEELAMRADVPVGTVNKIMSGATKSPQYCTVKRLEHVLEVDVSTNDAPENIRAELIDGIFYYMAAPTVIHQKLIGEVYYRIRSYIEHIKGKCEVMLSPITVQLEEDIHTMLEPDLMIICDEDKLKDGKYVQGAPDFVMEVVSESSKTKDYMIKLNKYWSSGVREYWIADPLKQSVTTYLFTNQDMDMKAYTFEDKVPINIYSNLLIDFKEIFEFIRSGGKAV